MSDTTAPRHYELLLILEPSIDERTVPTSVDTFLNVIRNGGGTVENVDIWGKRRLAYEIRKQSEGIYVVIDVNATSEVVDELDRQLNLNESVMRTKITRPPAPKRPTAAAAAS
ncbi:30S ribosomal protein S6 [Nakamurella aerolata]|uniref:30S ribosomal protein S6 n=1 Tax=Nakamurella aerolata TaxID=1656892 RepID=UPI001FE7C8EE|nr:30S ribosomal protein S6 [Nakamurella aerolata]